jgi:hypothetical protein
VTDVTDERQRKDEHRLDPARVKDARTGNAAAANRIREQTKWVDLQIQQAMARGEFDDLPGAGKPIEGLGDQHDPDWWVKKLIEREQITGVLPPALQLRKEDAELDAKLDSLHVEAEVRRELEDFNARVLRARYTPVDGPPLVTQPRDVEADVAAWAQRRAARLAASRRTDQRSAPTTKPSRRGWFRRGMRHTDR